MELGREERIATKKEIISKEMQEVLDETLEIENTIKICKTEHEAYAKLFVEKLLVVADILRSLTKDKWWFSSQDFKKIEEVKEYIELCVRPKSSIVSESVAVDTLTNTVEYFTKLSAGELSIVLIKLSSFGMN